MENLNSLLLSFDSKDAKELIIRNIKDIDRITNQVLCKYRSEAPEASLNHENNLNHVLRDLSAKFEKQIEINYSFSSEFNWHNVDSIVFYRIFTNLIKNSINANATALEIHGSYQNKSLHIDIADNGTGIKKNLQPYIFENGVTSNKYAGNGLGLNYVKEKLIELNCSISLAKSNLNGTTFAIKLPLEEIILIDDNEIIRDTWQALAKKAGIQLRSYARSIDFKPDLELKTTPIFVDYDLDGE